jgi:hypothetical protein
MMNSFILSLGLLGLLAVDPVGIAAMPVLLLQKQPFKRSLVFLLGSFVSLIVMGLAFVYGLGVAVLRFEAGLPWLVPVIEIAGSVVLFILAVIVAWRQHSGRNVVGVSKSILRWLQLKNWQVFTLGAVIVGLQSMIDVVFVVAMIHVEQLHPATGYILTAVTIYAVGALLIQAAIVMAYIWTPAGKRTVIIDATNRLLARYAGNAVIVLSVLLGAALLLNGWFALIGYPHI